MGLEAVALSLGAAELSGFAVLAWAEGHPIRAVLIDVALLVPLCALMASLVC